MFGIIILIVLFTILIIVLSKASESKQNVHHSKTFYYDDDLEDDFSYDQREERLEEIKDSVMINTDISEMDPVDMMYLDEDGDIQEDL